MGSESGYNGQNNGDVLKLFAKVRPFLKSIKDIFCFPFKGR